MQKIQQSLTQELSTVLTIRRAIYFYDGATNATITNQKEELVYNTASDAITN